MSRKQLDVLSFNENNPEIVYLASLLRKYKTKNTVSNILNIKALFLNITEIKNQATKEKLSKEYHKKCNKLCSLKKHGELEKNTLKYSVYAMRKKWMKCLKEAV